jgi:hypothetical protein
MSTVHPNSILEMMHNGDRQFCSWIKVEMRFLNACLRDNVETIRRTMSGRDRFSVVSASDGSP